MTLRVFRVSPFLFLLCYSFIKGFLYTFLCGAHPHNTGALKRGQPTQVNTAFVSTGGRNSCHPASSRSGSAIQPRSDCPHQARVKDVHHGIYPLAFSKDVVVSRAWWGTAALLNVPQIDGDVPGVSTLSPAGGCWSVAFSYGDCEMQRLADITRLCASVSSVAAPPVDPILVTPFRWCGGGAANSHPSTRGLATRAPAGGTSSGAAPRLQPEPTSDEVPLKDSESE